MQLLELFKIHFSIIGLLAGLNLLNKDILCRVYQQVCHEIQKMGQKNLVSMLTMLACVVDCREGI